MTGDWNGALEDQFELERIQAETVAALPVGYTLRAYSASAFVHELRGDEEQAASYLGLVEEFIRAHPISSFDRHAALALAARALAHRGSTDEARAVFDDLAGLNAPPTLEALCEIVADREDWVIAGDVLESSRRQAEISEAHALPAFADRLEARLASVEGDPTRAASLLRRSAAGFAELGAAWEEALSRLLLAEALVELSESREARRERDAARVVFERLGSARERDRAAALVVAA